MTQQQDDVAALARLEQVREEMHQQARTLLGIGAGTVAGGLRSAMRASGSRWYPLLALGGLVVVDRAQSFAVFVLGPEIAGGTGVSQTQLATLVALKTLAIALAALPVAAAVEHHPRRAAVAIACGLVWAVATAGTGLATAFWGLLFFFVLDGISTGAVVAVHHPLLADSYPPTLRMRVISAYEAMASFGQPPVTDCGRARGRMVGPHLARGVPRPRRPGSRRSPVRPATAGPRLRRPRPSTCARCGARPSASCRRP